jgi:hypothetical protein
MPPDRRRSHDQDTDVAEPLAGDASHARPAGQERADRIESEAQLAGVVQRKSEGAGLGGGDLGEDVADRIQGERDRGQPIDAGVREQVERTVGHDLGGVRVHQGEESATLNRQVGAMAFTTGRDIFLGAGQSPTDAALLSHEAAHAVQQGMSEERPASIGASDTGAEHAADSLGASVTASPQEIQRYTDDKKIEGQYARISDGGNVIVLGQSNYSQDLYATDGLISSANAKLAASGDKGSYLRLIKSGETIEHGGKTLHRAAPVFKGQGDAKNAGLEKANKGKDEDDKLSLWADCGRSSRTVMGSHGDAAPHAAYKDGGKEQDTSAAYNPAVYSDEIYLATMPDFLANPAHADFLKEGVHYTGEPSNVIMPTTADQARAQYWELGDKGRRVFDKFAGINTAADPEVGGGYTMNTEYNMPGFKEQGDMTWNFHWAGVVMEDGTDNITLENYADGKGYDSVNTDWNFQMYGTVKKGQTFHEQHLATGTHANRASTFEVEPKGD